MPKGQVLKFRIALYGVLIEGGSVLLTDTAVPSGVITNFPGGGLELGEAPLEALAREFREETRIEVQVGELLFCSQRFQQNPEYPHEQLMHIYYRVRRVSGDVTDAGNNDDVVAVRWTRLDQLASRRILEVDREFTNHPSFLELFAPAGR